MNSVKINGKYICPLLEFIWFLTMLCIVAYRDSKAIDHLLLTTFSKLGKRFNIKIINAANIKYNPIFVIDISILHIVGKSIVKKCIISN